MKIICCVVWFKNLQVNFEFIEKTENMLKKSSKTSDFKKTDVLSDI